MTPGEGLPRELEALVERVARETGLPLRDREEVARELRNHFEDGLAAGHGESDLFRRFGDPSAAARRIREARHTGGAAMRGRMRRRWRMSVGDVRRELERSIRTLARSPGHTLVVVLTLALGVGANTAVFTVLDSVLLEPLPYPRPEQLVRVYDTRTDGQSSSEYLRSPAVNSYRGWDQVFQGLSVAYTYRETGADLTDGDRPVRVVATQVSAGYFETLGVEPLAGRGFRPEESISPGYRNADGVGASVAVISHALWEDRYGGDRSVVGRTIQLGGRAFQVVGVMPPGFIDPVGSQSDVWLPLDLRDREGQNDWGNYYLTGIGRLAPGLSVEGARGRLEALNQRFIEEHPEADGWAATIQPLHDDLVGSERRSLLWVLSAAVGLVLLSACLNVANLVFARGLSRDRDLALRGALGSGRGRIVASLLSETFVLALAGGVAGLALGALGVRGLLAAAPEALPVMADPRLSGRVFLFALGCVVVSLVLFGLAPALRLSRTAPADILRAGGRGGTQTRGLRRVRSGLVVAQVGVAVTLVVGAGLLVHSFQKLRSVDLGFRDDGVLTFEVHLPTSRYPDREARERFHRELDATLAALPEVESAASVSWLPVNGRYHSWTLAVQPGWNGEGRPDNVDWIPSDVRVVTGDYFGTLRIPVVRGAGLEAADPEGPPVAWLSRAAAAALFPDHDPLEQVVYFSGEVRRVVGIVGDTPHDARGHVVGTAYVLHAQADERNWAMIRTVRVRGDLAEARERIRTVLASVDPDLVLYRPRALSSLLAGARAQDRFATLLMAVFAFLALTVAAVGSYGIMAESVARRRREIGIRLALGADPGSVRSMVLASSLLHTVTGVALGLGGIWFAGRWIQAFLFEVKTWDPVVYALGAGLILGLGAVAGWIPARAATRVHPVETLSAE